MRFWVKNKIKLVIYIVNIEKNETIYSCFCAIVG